MSAGADGLALALEAIDATGWKAFPVQQNKKPYRGSHGFLDATDDPDELARMWRPDALPALAVPEGFVVVDVDSAEAEDRVDLPVTKVQRTRRGKHFIYRTREPVRPAVAIAENVDLRGPGSYIVLYERFWRRRAEYADAPAEVYEKGRAAREALEVDEDTVWGEGERDENLTRFAGRLFNAGLEGEPLLAALWKYNLDHCDPPLPKSQVRKIARSSLRWERSDPADDVPMPRIVYRSAHPVASDPGPRGVDAADLLAEVFDPIQYAVMDILPEGTAILAAEPKIGKSWLAYQACVEVALGGRLLGKDVRRGSALYYALEDGPRRGQDRLRKALRGRTLPRGRLEVRWSCPPIGRGLEEELAEWLDSHEDAVLVVIDTLQKARPPSSGKRGSYEVDVEDLGRLQEVFRGRRVTLVVVHHARKAKSDDFLAAVSGTFGITGSADTTLVLKRERLQSEASLDVTGRDIHEQALGLRFDPVDLWQYAPVAVVTVGGAKRKVVDWLSQNGPGTASDMVSDLGMSREHIAEELGKLLREGKVEKTGARRGEYSVVEEE